MAHKVVLITGCSSGIGLNTAVMLAKDENKRFKVFATMRNLAKQDKLSTAAGDMLDKTLFVRELDVNKEDAIVEFIERMNREEGGVDILINNAGIGQFGFYELEPMQTIRGLYETNVFGLIRMIQAVTPNMKAKKSGHIINISSVAGLVGLPFCEIYASSKFAVEGFSESIAPLLRPFNISVSLIEPGPVKTSFGDNMSANRKIAPTADNPAGLSLDGVDETSIQQYRAFVAGSVKRFGTKYQTGDDIAVVINDAILSDKPHLHYPTSESVTTYSERKYKDITGDEVVEMIAERNASED